ncbi:MAG: acetamidase/formamidase family protein [Solirubrobacteraceae bacterium]|jgi:acetamidase/formamidase
MARTHYLSDEQVHYKWDIGNEPVITIESGDTVVVWTRDIGDNQVSPEADASVLANFDWDRAYALSGPIGIDGAAPGDTLRVDVLDVHTQGWGWTGVLPGFGLLAKKLPDAYLRTFDLSNGEVAYLREDIAVPGPQYRAPAPLTARVDSAPFFATTGVGGELYAAAQDAVRAMIEHTVTAYELRPEDAYVLCSIAVDLKISEIVNGGVYIVSALLPEAIFTGGAARTNGAIPATSRVPATVAG